MSWTKPGRSYYENPCSDRRRRAAGQSDDHARPDDIQAAAELLADLSHSQMLLADRAYDADWLRSMVGEKGGWANIPPKANARARSASRPGSTNRAT